MSDHGMTGRARLSMGLWEKVHPTPGWVAFLSPTRGVLKKKLNDEKYESAFKKATPKNAKDACTPRKKHHTYEHTRQA